MSANMLINYLDNTPGPWHVRLEGLPIDGVPGGAHYGRLQILATKVDFDQECFWFKDDEEANFFTIVANSIMNTAITDNNVFMGFYANALTKTDTGDNLMWCLFVWPKDV